MKNSIIKVAFFISTLIILSHCDTQQTVKKESKFVKKIQLTPNKYSNTIFEEVYKKLKSGDTISKIEIADFSKDSDTRGDFYELLSEFDKLNLFPNEYKNFEKASESILTNWLEYPTELDTIPSKIEFLKKVTFIEKDTTYIYYAFQFRTDEPHWAAKDGWMIGVVGPYFTNSKPYDFTKGTFSRFTKTKETSSEKEVQWAHENVYKRNPE